MGVIVYMKMYFSILEDWEDLTDEEVGILLRACLAYAKDGVEPSFAERELRIAFRAQKRHIDEDRDAYADLAEKRAVAGAMGGRHEKQKKQMLAKEANASNCSQEKEKEKEKENPSKEGVRRFTPPTADEVAEYCDEKGYAIDPERFVSFYAQKGWMVGKNKMVDWKAAVRNWATRDRAERAAAKPQTQYSNAELEKLEVDLNGGDFSW